MVTPTKTTSEMKSAKLETREETPEEKARLDEQIRIYKNGKANITVSRRAFENHYEGAGYKLEPQPDEDAAANVTGRVKTAANDPAFQNINQTSGDRAPNADSNPNAGLREKTNKTKKANAEGARAKTSAKKSETKTVEPEKTPDKGE